MAENEERGSRNQQADGNDYGHALLWRSARRRVCFLDEVMTATNTLRYDVRAGGASAKVCMAPGLRAAAGGRAHIPSCALP
jgi:hypothetical protein